MVTTYSSITCTELKTPIFPHCRYAFRTILTLSSSYFPKNVLCNVFVFILLLPQGRAGEVWKPSKPSIPFVLPAKQKCLSLLSCLLLSYSLMLCVTTPNPPPNSHPNPSHATSWIASLSQRRVPLEFLLDKVALVQVLLRAFQFSCHYYSTNAHLNLQRRCYKKGKQAKSEGLS